ncbi:hypothetical protein ACP275_08G222600 [Erythranthe tilingii]
MYQSMYLICQGFVLNNTKHSNFFIAYKGSVSQTSVNSNIGIPQESQKMLQTPKNFDNQAKKGEIAEWPFNIIQNEENEINSDCSRGPRTTNRYRKKHHFILSSEPRFIVHVLQFAVSIYVC